LTLTKADKLSKTKQIKQYLAVAETLAVDQKDLILFSSKSRLGKEAVWGKVKKLIKP
jgi:GTP-binding protein